MPAGEPEMEILRCVTIGHSTNTIATYTALLTAYMIDSIIDVRSTPYSRFNPQFNRETLKTDLELEDITYLFLGDRLGARREEPEVYFPDGIVNFEKVRELTVFKEGIDQVVDMIRSSHKVALMCAEKEPFDCHRFVLIAPALTSRGVRIEHILSVEETVTQQSLEDRLIKKYNLDNLQASLFNPPKSRDARLQEAYVLRNRDIGYSKEEKKS